ncbi:MAG: hypothetical protein HY343_03080 [Lentisphaerae bacterium]|nr:hypothetical protein [Lentisphaerota bacterium]
MLPNAVVLAANVCQSLVPFIAMSAYLPQWGKLWKKRATEGVSLRSWLMWSFSSSFALFYAVVQLLLNGRGWPLVVSSLISAMFVLITVSLILRARRMTPGVVCNRRC